MRLKNIWEITLRLGLIIFFFGAAVILQQKSYLFPTILCLGIAFGLVFELVFHLQRHQNEHEKVVLAMLKNDYSLNLKPKSNTLHKSLIQLYKQQKKEHVERKSYQILFKNILNELDVGILILEKNTEQDWRVFYTNPRFLNIIDLPRYKDWNFYKQRVNGLVKLLEEIDYQNANQSIELKLNENEKQNFALRSNRIELTNKSYFILALDAIQSIIERKEKQAYYNLMKVISHELLNTLTPVHSLLQDLQDFRLQDNPTEEDKEELTHSLEMIERKSNHLLSFVNNYRLIGQLPSPKKQRISVKALIESTIDLMKKELIEAKITPNLALQELFIDADLEMMERVMINLISNSMNALTKKENKILRIKNYKIENKLMIEVIDNGVGVSPEIEDKVFIPFFTTREDGGGIGLTLAKSIVDAHNGWINFQSNQDETVFKVILNQN